MSELPTSSLIDRRDWLKLSGVALAGVALAPPGAALVRGTGETGVPCHRPSVAQIAHKHLVDQHLSGLDANADDARQHNEHRMGCIRRRLGETWCRNAAAPPRACDTGYAVDSCLRRGSEAGSDAAETTRGFLRGTNPYATGCIAIG